ncbi:hypothetical protein [Verminephrobacter aporrectodeae]|uniref:hypothetical protein n=1 Tax=Verminephrobacter aporrectodeae TaxID=1110389 RepID=UPI0011102E39|nr:hypothetical protein [Verminephrobacter aporrectodeae]
MKFLVEYTSTLDKKSLKYNIEECSFDTEPSIKEINFDIVLNKINLTVVDNDNKIVQLWGFSGYNEWIKSNHEAPPCQKGILKVLDDLEPGFSYCVSKDDFPVYVNIRTGWVCIGNPEGKGSVVEFINNCIAIIDDDKEFVSLWLRPEKLPNI